jgi:hypothetical protein
VGVSVGTAGRDGLVGGISVGGGGGVAVETRGGVGGGEQERRRKIQKTERRMRDVMGWGMEGILTELSTNYVSRINEKTSRQVPDGRKVCLSSSKPAPPIMNATIA